MLHWRHRRVFFSIIAGLFLTGCATASKRPPASTTSPLPATSDVDDKIVQAHAHYALGMIYDLDEQPDLAREELAKAATADPSNADLVLELTRGYLQDKQPEKALELLLRATALPRASGSLYARLAVVYSRLGKDEQAMAAAQTAIKRAPELLDGYRVLFLMQVQKGRPKEALKVLDQAAKASDVDAEFGIELVDLYVALEKQAPSEKSAIVTNALTLLNHAASLNPTDPQLRLRLADDYDAFGATTNAAAIYLQLIDAFSDLPAARTDVRDKLARMYLREKDNKKASEQLEAIVTDDPTNWRAYYLLGTLMEEQEKLSEAADYYQKTLLLSEDVEEVYYDLARVEIDLNKPELALATLMKAHLKFKPSFVPEVLAALACEKQKDYTNAVGHFTAAEVIAKTGDPERLNGGFYFDQGAACERAGQFDQAEKCFEKSLALTPNFPEALNYLGYMLADKGVQLEKAHDLIAKAVKIEPKNPAYLDSLGWVLYKLNRSQEALPQIEEAIKLSKEPDPTLYDHLGDIYAALKDTMKARNAWTKSLGLEANDEIRKKLDNVGGKIDKDAAH